MRIALRTGHTGNELKLGGPGLNGFCSVASAFNTPELLRDEKNGGLENNWKASFTEVRE